MKQNLKINNKNEKEIYVRVRTASTEKRQLSKM